jgi:hypothetical protein
MWLIGSASIVDDAFRHSWATNRNQFGAQNDGLGWQNGREQQWLLQVSLIAYDEAP